MSATLRDLRVWQEAVALAADVVRATRRTARREVKPVTDDLMLAALAVAAGIAEGAGEHQALEQRACYRAARRALLRLETGLAIARQAGLLDEDTLAALSRRVQSVARLLGGFLVYLERQIEPEAAAR